MKYKQILYNVAAIISPNFNKELSEILKENKNISIFDIGFYQGDFSIKLINELSKHQELDQISITSFDPNTKIDLTNFKVFSKNFNITWKHHNYALGDKNSIEMFTTLKNFPSSGSSINNILKNSLWLKTRKVLLFPFLKNKEIYESFNIEQKQLDSIDLQIDSVDVIKIDVEGYTYEVLRGSKNFIEKYSPVIQLEILAKKVDYNISKERICKFLHELNYELKSEKKHPTTHIFSDVICSDLLFIS